MAVNRKYERVNIMKKEWEKIKRWFRYWIVYRTFGGSVMLKDVPRIDIEKPEFTNKIRLCHYRGKTKGRCSKR